MAEPPFNSADLEALKGWDTPTICNGIEIVAPRRRAIGFTTEPMVVADRTLPPIIGVARTGFIRAREKPRRLVPSGEESYDSVAAHGIPTIAVLQDIDEGQGFVAVW